MRSGRSLPATPGAHVEKTETGGRSPATRGGVFPALLFTVASFLFLSLDWVTDKFGAVTLDQIQFVYYSPLAGVDTTLVVSYAGRMLVLLLLLGLFLLLTRALRNAVQRDIWRARTRKLLFCGTALYFLAALAGTAVTFNVPALLARQESPFIRDHYALPANLQILFPEKKRNLIIILAESAEHTFNNTELFGEAVMPELAELAERNLSFRGHVQVPGTEWTIAGITSFLFGIPLRLPLFDWNNYSLFDTFLPGADSLLETFAEAGYETAMLLGSDSSFSGKKNLFAIHAPQSRVYDLNYFQKVFPEEAIKYAGTGWGLADHYLFAQARELLSARQSDAPFLLIVETVDTHIPDPFIPEGAPRKWDDYRDAFASLSGMVSEFVDWLERQDFYADTTVVILGDHLHMADELGPVDLREKKREIYNVFINATRPAPVLGANRVFASFDLCPTILESVGVELAGGRFGLGASLFQAGPTLLEEKGVEAVVHELTQFSSFYTAFYKTPALQRPALASCN